MKCFCVCGGGGQVLAPPPPFHCRCSGVQMSTQLKWNSHSPLLSWNVHQDSIKISGYIYQPLLSHEYNCVKTRCACVCEVRWGQRRHSLSLTTATVSQPCVCIRNNPIYVRTYMYILYNSKQSNKRTSHIYRFNTDYKNNYIFQIQ